MSEIETKYFNTADYNKFTSQALDAQKKEKELVNKSAIAAFKNSAYLDKKSSNINNKSRIESRRRKNNKT